MTRRAALLARGFTLVELVVVIVITGIMAASLVVFLRPAMDSYVRVGQTGDLMQAADNALFGMVNDVRSAVPNSIRSPTNQCMELVPTVGGGRYRAGPDTVNDVSAGCSPAGNCAAWVDPTAATTMFDVLQYSGRAAKVGDWVVINNQNANDVYEKKNAVQVTAVATPAASQGVARLTIASLQVSPGYDGGRYSVVDNAAQSVFYSCVNATGVDANGNGLGELRRNVSALSATVPTSCPASGSIVTKNVKSCNFVYDPNQGATQQSGFVWMEVEVARAGAISHLSMGAHVSNVP